ncbi:hypothetical protein Pmar_PMAR009725 [Perkinsus marinus ATCC 50983]|uniref:Chaperone DnaJ C-terminal domain-containing protein n=1 Tax=Perkinsus marinus (strain ATCC 50983 / TXsc) TaxID=423536 RepID=C5L235_PERM5|nr:hypothetical protein Pmar_PMAR009725 [Perkinsus marinus ATCC 50983]EER09228.1 hypothetical protein Pmar_PMAR009725 [Perkinsus marinus ATCC 50983]|eukprot:XP_002777412.1 hypothetical protein Pmar_PMAR009725 [Perkinsus marinus ATCC 50983]
MEGTVGTRIAFAGVRIIEVVIPGFTRVIRGSVMPISEHPGQHGDLVVTFDIIFPNTRNL